MRSMKILLLLLLTMVLLLTACSANGGTKAPFAEEVTMFKAPTCGCCGVYAKYMKKSDVSLTLKEVSDVTPMKDELGIPANMRSCHTMKVGDYFVEGHVPLEAIQKMMNEKPDIKGIMMPGMPPGSPGMPGTKQGTWTIYALEKDGSITEFMQM